MIFVDRNDVQEPGALRSQKVKEAQRRAREFFSGRRKNWEGFNFETRISREVKPDLVHLFRGKCAYCETHLSGLGSGDAELFRPKGGFIDPGGKFVRPGYWWLAYSWTNFYYCCSVCNRQKGSRFPLEDESKRARTPGQETHERPLLLDPCADHPEEHLLFEESGMVVPRSHRGEVTIEVIGLNRPALIEGRSRVARVLLALIPRATRSAKGTKTHPLDAKSVEKLAEFLKAEQEHSAVCRQIIASRTVKEPELRMKLEAATGLHRSIKVSATTATFSRKLSQEYKSKIIEKDSYSIESADSRAKYFQRSRYIERVEIENFKAIENLTLDFSASPSQTQPWCVLLGENGAGKTSVLEAITLALAGDRYANSQNLKASDFVCRNGDAARGSVRVFLTGSTQPIEMRFSRSSPTFEHSDKEPKVLLLSYGATRLLPRDKQAIPKVKEFVRIQNLFDPFVPLSDPDSWLTDTVEVPDAEFRDKMNALKRFLPINSKEELVRDSSGLYAKVGKTQIPLRHLSAGFQVVIGLVSDLFRILRTHWSTIMESEGIVLLDEIGEHLHPTWKRRVVHDLRAAFPRVQFIATTHDPLCLRGVFGKEVVLMRRNSKNQVYALTNLPPVESMRVDQLLTSEFFGLNSAYDDEAEALFTEYYELLAMNNRSNEQERRLKELRNQVEEREVLGSTRRERLLLQVIDEYLARESELSSEESRAKLKRKVGENIAGILL